jgi:hypothetical protein
MMKVVYKRDEQRTERTESCILKLLAYFSVFDYPLTKEELNKYLDPSADPYSFDIALTQLVEEGSIFKIEDFYLLVDDSRLVKRRREGNWRAAQLLPKAMKVGRFLSRFPM